MLVAWLRAAARNRTGGPGGSLSSTLTVGANSDNTTYWVRGWVNSTSVEYGETAAVVGSSSTTPATIGSATAVAIFWRSTLGSASTGQVYAEITGNWGAGALSSLTVAGVSQGAVGTPTYNSSTNTTTFPFGSAVTNPFGTSGTKAIVLS